MDVLYEDHDILVVIKPVGVESQTAKGLEPDMVSEIKNYLTKPDQTSEPYVGVVHRLDKPVSGVMVYAKTPEAAAVLSKQVADKSGMKKIYHAVVCGLPADKNKHMTDYMMSDPKTNMTVLTDAKNKSAKKAEMNVKLLKKKYIDGEQISELEIELITGRHHQIRAQLAGHGNPIIGDYKYNPAYNMKDDKGKAKPAEGLCGLYASAPALAAVQLTFTHPKSRKQMTYQYEPTGGVWDLFK